MIWIYYSLFRSKFSPETTRRLSKSVTFDPRFPSVTFRRWQDTQAHLIGRLLLARGAAAMGFPSLPTIRYSEYHRPYVDLPLDFSISHSGEYVLCALADDRRIGVDIEKIRPIELADLRLSFSDQEWNDITRVQDSSYRLFDHWTRKEAIAKADGRGMHVAGLITLNGLEAEVEGVSYVLDKLTFAEDYCSYVASQEVDRSAISYTKVEFE